VYRAAAMRSELMTFAPVTGKAFDITYVRLWFYSPRAESFAIYKRTSEDGPWIPYQFYRWVSVHLCIVCVKRLGAYVTLWVGNLPEQKSLCVLSEVSGVAVLLPFYVEVKVKLYPCNRPCRPIGLWDIEAPIFSVQSAHRWRWGCQPYAQAGRH
jgi:hypothetical protein